MSAETYLAYDFPLLSAFWTLLIFFLWVLWFVLLFRVIVDVFRDDGLSGWAKAGWLVFVVVLPFLGVFVYVVARGRNMGRRESDHARAQQKAFDAYVRDAAKGSDTPRSSADELAKLSEIKARGDITDEEFRRAKELVLSGHGHGSGHGSGAGQGSGASDAAR